MVRSMLFLLLKVPIGLLLLLSSQTPIQSDWWYEASALRHPEPFVSPSFQDSSSPLVKVSLDRI
jgi:hypothetical protein